jgi:hypothetical protein
LEDRRLFLWGSVIEQKPVNAEEAVDDFMFQLSREEFANLKSQFVISSWGGLRLKMVPQGSEVPMPKQSVVPLERIEGAILVLRGQKVIPDKDLAVLWGDDR